MVPSIGPRHKLKYAPKEIAPCPWTLARPVQTDAAGERCPDYANAASIIQRGGVVRFTVAWARLIMASILT